MSTLLEIRGLYGGYEKGVNILQGADMTIEEGEAVGIIGLNGSGKSTLGKAIVNLIPYRRGSIVYNGKHIEDKTTHELAQMGIALMHQGGAVFPNLSVWHNLQLALGTKPNKDYYRQLVDIIPLLQRPEKELMHQMADKLSGGQRHELALAMTLARNPKLVILDEPSAGLSPQAVRDLYAQGDMYSQNTIANTSALCPNVVSQINGILVELKDRLNMSMLLVEQNVSLAESFCDRCVLMEQGTIKHEVTRYDVQRFEHFLFDKKEDKTTLGFYSKDFWNNIYQNHYDDAPWMNDSWKGVVLNLIEQYIPENATFILDYGCGNGYMGKYFYDKGFHVDLSDISDKLIEILKNIFAGTSIGIFQTDKPEELLGKKYDVIIAWSLFHHINPVEWKNFLGGFCGLLNDGGVLVIGGWDEKDTIIKEDGNLARYTGCETWCINNLGEYVDYKILDLLKEGVVEMSVPPFMAQRIQHYFILSKKQ